MDRRSIPVQSSRSNPPVYLLKRILSKRVLRQFEELTGFALSVYWPEDAATKPTEGKASTCPSAERVLQGGGKLTELCRSCLAKHWDETVLKRTRRRRFSGTCAQTSLCLGFRWSDCQPVVFIVQGSMEKLCSRTLPEEPLGSTGPRFGSDQFDRAEWLLRIILHDLRSAFEAHEAKRNLEAAYRRIEELEASHTVKEGGELPQSTSTSPVPLADGKGQQIVQAMVDYVRANYQHPMSLKQVATFLGMNANYLSGLFHRSTGTAFHRYLQAVRISKAEELLRDPRLRIQEVAAAVGYVSSNHFRSAFKAWEKLSPSAWTRAQAGRSSPKDGNG